MYVLYYSIYYSFIYHIILFYIKAYNIINIISTEHGTLQYSKVNHFDNVGTATGINPRQTSFEDSGCLCIYVQAG